MYDRELRLYRFLLDYCRGLIADIDDSKLRGGAAENMNTPQWLLGHLAICTDYTLQLAGLAKRCPDEWHKWFGPGSKPEQVPSPGPTKAELFAALETGHKLVDEAAPKFTEEQLAGPHQIAFLLPYMPTKADLVSHLLTTHEATHLGQLSAWRRRMGMPSVRA
jgi:uncharacterized damage-inducible protein DinB